jgi:hypothetical protein
VTATPKSAISGWPPETCFGAEKPCDDMIAAKNSCRMWILQKESVQLRVRGTCLSYSGMVLSTTKS